MKTALTELIERLERHSIELKGSEKTIQADGAIRMCIIEATELLEKEREQIEKEVNDTTRSDVAIANNALKALMGKTLFDVKGNEGEQYYNETYKQ